MITFIDILVHHKNKTKMKTIGNTTMPQRERLNLTGKNGGFLVCWVLFLTLTNEKVLNEEEGFYGHWDHTKMWISRELTGNKW